MSMYLYYGTLNRIEGGILKPSQYRQAKNGRDGFFVFATHRVDMAMVYASPWLGPGAMMRTINDADPEDRLAVFINKDYDARMQAFEGTVYRIPSVGFERVNSRDGTPLREWVSDKCVDLFSHEISTLEINSVNQFTQAGVQVFFAKPEIAEKLIGKMGETTFIATLSSALAREPESNLMWANARDGLGCDPRIASGVEALAKSQKSPVLNSRTCGGG